MSLTQMESMPDLQDEILGTTHEMIVRGYNWYGVGYWSIAEQLYKTGMLLAITSNNVHAAIQLGTNLSVCYLGAKSYNDAYRSSRHVYSVAVTAKNQLSHRLGTVQVLSLISAGQEGRLDELLKTVDLEVPDKRIWYELRDIYRYMGDDLAADDFFVNWQAMVSRL